MIEANVLRGGMIEFFDGPWRIVDNDFRGTPPGTYSHAVFAGHGTHDIVVRGNKTRSDGPSGKTWRFLVLTWFGADDVVEGNTIEQVGARDDDTIPWSNEPEIILTEAYHLKYEGKVMALVERRPRVANRSVAGRPVATGDVVSLLNGPAAGQWRRVVQAIDSTAYLVDAAIPPGTEAVSISTGFVGQTYERNRIDVRGGRRSTPLVLAGNHFGTRVIKNHFLGGEFAFQADGLSNRDARDVGLVAHALPGGRDRGQHPRRRREGGNHRCRARRALHQDEPGAGVHDGQAQRQRRSLVGRVSGPTSGDRDTRQAPPGSRSATAPSHDAGELIVTAREQSARGTRRTGGRDAALDPCGRLQLAATAQSEAFLFG